MVIAGIILLGRRDARASRRDLRRRRGQHDAEFRDLEGVDRLLLARRQVTLPGLIPRDHCSWFFVLGSWINELRTKN
jgi:hypothetical protein